MEPKFKTSFIPKKPVATVAKGKVNVGKGLNFMTLFSTVIFLAAALFAGGMFMYKLNLEQRIESQLQTLEKVRQTFEPNFIAQATRLNNRIVAAGRILERHLAPSAIFELLEEFTLQTVAFKTFEFTDNADGEVVIKGAGEGDSFRSVVLQSDEFGSSGYMRDVLFADLEPNQRGNVQFSFEAVLDPQLILYRKGLVPIIDTETPDVEQLDDQEDVDLGVFGEGDNGNQQ
ncbi:hypothetical protein N9L18_00585 [Candidatus Pacebacteria bacterium]|nr:hypothetical protein [Candidatus Paceibacterota bacterium]